MRKNLIITVKGMPPFFCKKELALRLAFSLYQKRSKLVRYSSMCFFKIQSCQAATKLFSLQTSLMGVGIRAGRAFPQNACGIPRCPCSRPEQRRPFPETADRDPGSCRPDWCSRWSCPWGKNRGSRSVLCNPKANGASRFDRGEKTPVQLFLLSA